jgi:tetratricopeptide (TPR) repeat protein
MKLKFKDVKNILLLNNEAKSLNAEGNELLTQKKWADAAKRFRDATEIEPKCASYWNDLAMCYYELELVLEMKDAAQKCIEIDPTFRDGYYHLTKACFTLMEFERLRLLRSRHVTSPGQRTITT